jgi:hypothetical protein
VKKFFLVTLILAVFAALAAPFKTYWKNAVASRLFAKPQTTAACPLRARRRNNPDIGEYMSESGRIGLDVEIDGTKYATIQAAMDAAIADDIILVGPGTYQEDVTWSNYSGIQLLPKILGTVVVEAVTAFAISIDPAAASSTWSATIGIKLSHGDGLTGLKVNNTNVGKRINLYLLDMDVESETATDNAIVVTRSGASANAIRIYASASRQATIEGLVTVALESADDRVRFNNYRLIGGITVTGAVANAEITLEVCGIKTSGRAFPAEATHNIIACWEETDANPNVYTAIADEVAQTATS